MRRIVSDKLKCRITEPAKADLMGIWQEIARDNRQAADGVLQHIDKQFDILVRSPNIGRIRPEFTPLIPVFPCFKAGWRSRFMIFYRVNGNAVQIIRVIEAHREIFPELFDETM